MKRFVDGALVAMAFAAMLAVAPVQAQTGKPPSATAVALALGFMLAPKSRRRVD